MINVKYNENRNNNNDDLDFDDDDDNNNNNNKGSKTTNLIRTALLKMKLTFDIFFIAGLLIRVILI
jgi:hypothetical protein